MSLPDATAIAALQAEVIKPVFFAFLDINGGGTLQYQRRGRHPVWHGRSGPRRQAIHRHFRGLHRHWRSGLSTGRIGERYRYPVRHSWSLMP